MKKHIQRKRIKNCFYNFYFMFGNETFHSFVLEEISLTEHQFGQQLADFIQQSQQFFKEKEIQREIPLHTFLKTISQLLWPISQWSLDFAKQISEHTKYFKRINKGKATLSSPSPYMSPELAFLFVDKFARLCVFDDYCISFTFHQNNLNEILVNQDSENENIYREWHLLPLFGSMTIKDFLHKPLQRLTKYPLLLSRLLKEMDVDDVNYKMMEQTLNDISRHIQGIEKSQLKRDCQDLKGYLESGGDLTNYTEKNTNEDKKKLKEKKQPQIYFVDLVKVTMVNNREISIKTSIPKWVNQTSAIILSDTSIVFANHQIRQHQVTWYTLHTIPHKEILDIQSNTDDSENNISKCFI